MNKTKMRRFLNTKLFLQENMISDLNRIFNNQMKISHKNKFVNKDNVVYLLYLFEHLNSLNRNKDRNDEVQLSSKKLIKTFHSRYNDYITFLIDYDFIVMVKNYSTDNNRSKTYKLTSKYLKKANVFVEYQITYEALLEKVNYKNSGLILEQYCKNKFCKRKRPHLVKSFNNDLSMNIEKAMLEIKHFDLRSYRANSIIVNEYKNKLWKYSINQETDNRLHTLITRTNKKLLKYIRYNNKKLSEVDIKTSQPLFLYGILNALYVESSETELGNFINVFFDEKLIKKLSDIDLDLDELKTFGEIIVNKDLYDYLVSKVKISKLGDKFIRTKFDESASKMIVNEYDTKRELMKELVMEVLYSSSKNHSREVMRIKELFPTIFYAVDVIKNHSDKRNFFSKLLQNIEAYILLDIVAKEISKDFPKIPLFSKHDSLITFESHIKEVKDKVEQYIKKCIGIGNIRVQINNW